MAFLRVPLRAHLGAIFLLAYITIGLAQELTPSDPCAEIGGKKWASPAEVRACYQSYPLDPIIKTNVSILCLPHLHP